MRETELHSLEPFAFAYHGAVAVHRRARGARSQADSAHGRRDHKRGRHRERMEQAQDQATSHCDDELTTRPRVGDGAGKKDFLRSVIRGRISTRKSATFTAKRFLLSVRPGPCHTLTAVRGSTVGLEGE